MRVQWMPGLQGQIVDYITSGSTRLGPIRGLSSWPIQEAAPRRLRKSLLCGPNQKPSISPRGALVATTKPCNVPPHNEKSQSSRVNDNPRTKRSEWRKSLGNFRTDQPCPMSPLCYLTVGEIWRLIDAKDIRGIKPAMSISLGPDGLAARQLRTVSQWPLTSYFHVGNYPPISSYQEPYLFPKKRPLLQSGDVRPMSVSLV